MHFSGEVHHSSLLTQKTFRILLQAMSRPGRVYQFQTSEARTQNTEVRRQKTDKNGLSSVLLTLLDHEVSFCVIGTAKSLLEPEIVEITKSRAADISDADFIIVPAGESHGEILRAKRGSLEYPDTGATIIYSVHSLMDGNDGKSSVVLRGPGINGEISPFIDGLGSDEFSHLKEIDSEYPLGVDCIFVDSFGQVMCIPRSTRCEVI